MSKLLVRASVFTLVLAGVVASSLTPKTHASTAVTRNSMVVASALPVPSCDPGTTGCGIP